MNHLLRTSGADRAALACCLLLIGGCSETAPPPQPTTLAIAAAPSGGTAGVLLSPSLRVEIQDGSGNLVPIDDIAVNVAIVDPDEGVVLSGQATVFSVDGVATFSGLRINVADADYRLVATAPELESAMTQPFDVVAGAPNRLLVSWTPATIIAGAAIDPAIVVRIVDLFGNVVTTATDAMTLGLVTDSVATFVGTTSRAAVAGSATFDGLTITKAGDGYSVQATSPGLTAATSGTFDVVAGPAAALRLVYPHTIPVDVDVGEAFRLGAEVLDEFENVVLVPTAVTFGLSSGAEAQLVGETVVTTADGLASSWLFVDRPASDLVPTVASSGLAGDAGDPFDATFRLRRVEAGGSHSCGVTRYSWVYCWGANESGQLGDGTTETRVTPVRVALPAGATVEHLSVGTRHSCASDFSTGILYCWGANESGQLGDGTKVNRPTPVPVLWPQFPGLHVVRAADTHTCAVGLVDPVCWGRNAEGQLGDQTTTERLTPVEVWLPGGRRIAQTFSADSVHGCGITDVFDLFCWGNNESGQLGSDTASSPASAVQVDSMWSSIATGSRHSCGRTHMSLVMMCFGDNSRGQLGDGTTTPSAEPVAVGTGYGAHAAGSYHNCALVTGGVHCWGANDTGQLGDNSTADRSNPQSVVMTWDAEVVQLSAGAAHTCAIAGSSAYCWGDNASRQLGDGSQTERLTPVRVWP